MFHTLRFFMEYWWIIYLCWISGELKLCVSFKYCKNKREETRNSYLYIYSLNGTCAGFWRIVNNVNSVVSEALGISRVTVARCVAEDKSEGKSCPPKKREIVEGNPPKWNMIYIAFTFSLCSHSGNQSLSTALLRVWFEEKYWKKTFSVVYLNSIHDRWIVL